MRKRQTPLVGDGQGVMSFVHLDDAAAATVLALDHDGPAIYNIVDDEPAPMSDWLPVLAQAVGAKPPRHFPTWIARVIAGPGLTMLTEARGSSNAKASRELGWQPRYPSWREGFAAAYGEHPSTVSRSDPGARYEPWCPEARTGGSMGPRFRGSYRIVAEGLSTPRMSGVPVSPPDRGNATITSPDLLGKACKNHHLAYDYRFARWSVAVVAQTSLPLFAYARFLTSSRTGSGCHERLLRAPGSLPRKPVHWLRARKVEHIGELGEVHKFSHG